MSVQEFINKGLALIVTAAVSGGLMYWLCTGKYDDEVSELRDKVAELQKKEQAAMVTKRVSEQMEDIAFQQKAISDQQRERAERQSAIADMERGKAELERAMARESAARAVRSAHQADSMRLLAEYQTLVAMQEQQDALSARSKADTLFYNSLGKLLAQNAIAQSGGDSNDLAALLSFASWHYTRSYGGDVYQQDVFTALLCTAGNSMQLTGSLMGNVRSIERFGRSASDGDMFLAVTDYGEMALLTPVLDIESRTLRYKTRTIFSDSHYVFRDAKIGISGACYALDITGKLVCRYSDALRMNHPVLCLPEGRWEHLLRKTDGTLVAVSHNSVAWIDAMGRRVLKTLKVNDDIAEAGLLDDELLLFCKSGKMMEFDGYAEDKSVSVVLPKDETITAFEYLKDKKWMVLGTETGPIYIYDRGGRFITTLYGHFGRITHLERLEWMLVSSSYDHTLRLWDLRNVGSLMTPVNITYDRWPLCFAIDEVQRMVRVGMEGGDIRSVSISVEKNAESTRRALKREFTSGEWIYYIGKEVPYRKFLNYKP